MTKGKKRILSLLMALTLVTTSLIGNTFAKYVTSASASNTTARVAKWGVVVTANGNLFGETYIKADDNTPGKTGTLTVKSSSGNNVVAPGTQSTTNGLEFSVSGKPEVSVKITIDVTDVNDIYLKDVESVETLVGDMSADYYPVVFTLEKKNTSTNEYYKIESAGNKLSSIVSFLNSGGMSGNEILPNTNLIDTGLGGDFRLTWKWDYDDTSNSGANDSKDTLLGNLANNPSDYSLEASYYNTSLGLTFNISVTQVD